MRPKLVPIIFIVLATTTAVAQQTATEATAESTPGHAQKIQAGRGEIHHLYQGLGDREIATNNRTALNRS